MSRTLEQRLKFDSRLTIGSHLVRFTIGERSKLARVEIGSRGSVHILVEPDEGDMYASWARLRGDTYDKKRAHVLTWPRNNPDVMALFEGEPSATVPVHEVAE